jgi:asparagine synthase (glutamine-hydrolysing)
MIDTKTVADTPLQRIYGMVTPGALADPAHGVFVRVAEARGHSLARSGSLIAALAGRPRWNETDEAPETDHPAQRLMSEFRSHGVAALERIKGTFALAVVDVAARHALLAIDRMGVEALCYAECAGALCFGTRADAVSALLGRSPDIDPQALFDYLFFHMVPAPTTVFRGVRKLLPGQYLEYRDGAIKLDYYWRMQYLDRPTVPEGQLCRQFRDILPRAVSRQLDDLATGTFLSGGTDSSTVTGIFSRLRAAPVDAYSIGFDAEGFDEMEYARIAAKRFGARHHPYYVTPEDVLAAVPRIAAAYDEPFGNASAVAVYYCALQARGDGVRVMLAGDGGDELFGGNARYAKQKMFEAYARIPAAIRDKLIEPLALRVPLLERFPGVRKLKSYVEQARIPLPDRLEAYNFLFRAELAATLEPDFLASIRPEQPFEHMRAEYGRARSESSVNRMMHLDLKQTLADNDLRKVNVMCRLAGIDVRYPMLDDELVAFSGRVPPSGKVNGLRLRYFFKEALKDLLPPEIVAKRKHGFGLPFGVWMLRHPVLYELAADSLAAFRQRRLLQRRYVDSLLDRHRTDHASYYGVMVWLIMMLEQWLQARESMQGSVPAGGLPHAQVA